MRMLFYVTIPNEPFNTLFKNGQAGPLVGKILEEIKPEAVYFTAQNGQRSAFVIVNMESASDIPAFCEPWFLSFNANCSISPVMGPEDIQKAGLEEIAKKWE